MEKLTTEFIGHSVWGKKLKENREERDRRRKIETEHADLKVQSRW